MIRRLTGEYIASFGLIFCGTGAIVIDQETGGSITHLGVAIVFGTIVLAMILAFGPVSGSHMNPAVTVSLAIAGRFNKKHILAYIGMQSAGALSASYILKFLFPANSLLGATIPRGSDVQSLILEGILSFFLMIVILTSTEKKEDTLIGPALAIGATVGLEALFAGPICGASMNPIRSLSPAIASGHFQSVWIYMVGPFAGMFLAVMADRLIKEKTI